MAVDAADVRTSGDATADQRTELRELLESKFYALEWRTQLYADILADGGLSKSRAAGALNWLREQPNRDGSPIHATTEQIEQIETLLGHRIAPGPWAKLIRTRITAGTMTHVEAGRYLTDLDRMPMKVVLTATGPRVDGDTPLGYFALAHSDGETRCYRIHVARGGELIVEQFKGPKTAQRYQLRRWKADYVIKAIAADPAAAGRLFAATRKHCCNCNQPLRRQDQPGFPDGLGFDCWTQRQAAATTPDHTEGTDPHAHP